MEVQNSLQYATRVRTIKNDVTKMEASKEMLRLKRQVGRLAPCLPAIIHKHHGACAQTCLHCFSAAGMLMSPQQAVTAAMGRGNRTSVPS